MKRTKRAAKVDEASPFSRSKAAGSYGLTAVTLGDILKGQLDQAAAATGENRSELIRKALEAYFESLPELKAQRAESRERARELQVPFLFKQMLSLFGRMLREFDYRERPVPNDKYNSLANAISSARESLESELPSDLPYQLPAEINVALSIIRAGFHRFFQEIDGSEWRVAVDGWERRVVATRKAEPKINKEEKSNGDD